MALALDFPPANVSDAVATLLAEYPATERFARLWRPQVQNLGPNSVYVGFDNTVTETSGVRVPVGALYEIPVGAWLDSNDRVYGRCAAGEVANLRLKGFAE